VTTTYWWRDASVPNFGDRLNGFLQMQLGINPHWAPAADADQVIVGSILHHLPQGWGGTVCGAGVLYPERSADLTNATVLALRGKLTDARVKRAPGRVVYGDPGLLVSKFVPQTVAKYDLGVVPHWSDTELVKRFPYARVIDVRDHPEKVISEIASCRRIISSSLHGLVVADAYGIPRQAELFPLASREGGSFKFEDYASVFDTHPHFGEMWRAPHHIVERIQHELMEVLSHLLGVSLPACPPPPPPIFRSERRPKISLLVPFRDDGEHRSRVWQWLKRYWIYHLPSVEIIQGYDKHYPFSKATAVNNAAEQATGKVFVILDADAYLAPQVLRNCADNILDALKSHRRLWYMPYTHLYRLNRPTTEQILSANPRQGVQMITPPPSDWLEPGRSHHYGHSYGAMVQVMPREAFFAVSGMDCRFRGWGSEDASMLRALDTLYAPHELTSNDLWHLWHEHVGSDWRTRRWVGQYGAQNSRLAQRYAYATGEPALMQALVDEHIHPRPRARKRCCCLGRLVRR
jgi:hypothetical protein